MNDKRLCFATNNKGKLQEVRLLLPEWEILSLSDINCKEELPETHNTLEANSLEKAHYIFQKYQVNCFADDTGLEVDRLNGQPGVFSSHWAGPACSSIDNITLLLSKLYGERNRKARFRTVITLIYQGNVYQFDGTVSGTIAEQATGIQGFGYDPVFIPEGSNRSFAEFNKEEKNKVSHRGNAVRKLIEFLETGDIIGNTLAHI